MGWCIFDIYFMKFTETGLSKTQDHSLISKHSLIKFARFHQQLTNLTVFLLDNFTHLTWIKTKCFQT